MSFVIRTSVVFCFLAEIVLATELPQAEALRKLEFLAGDWQGSGWTQIGGQRSAFHGTESVRYKLNDTVLLIEGKHQGDSSPPGSEASSHNALGIIFCDPQTQEYKMHAFTGRGQSILADVKVDGSQIEWGFQSGQMRIRYTITIRGDEWLETGVLSKDGEEWIDFFEMKLERIDSKTDTAP